MRTLAAALSVFSMALAGCASHAKAVASASQPAPLSVPQTQVTLPPLQPLNPEALATEDAAPPQTPAAPAVTPAPPPPVRRPPRTTVAGQPAPAPVVAAPSAPPPVERPAIQAIIPAQEQKRLKDSADARKKEVRAALAKIHDQDLAQRIQFFLSQSDQAEHRGDMPQADVFAQRAQDLARGGQ